MKMDHRLTNISNWNKGMKMPPVTLELFPTFDCNQSCLFCPRKHIEKEEIGKIISDESLLEIIDQAAELGIKKIDLIGGGEPFKRNICIELIRKIKSKNIQGYLNTNFSLPTKEDIRVLAENAWDYIKISLHAPNRKHDLICNNKGAFGKIVRNIRILNKYKKKCGINLPELEFGPVLCSLNYLYVSDFIKLASNLGVRRVFFQPLIRYNSSDNYKMNGKQIDFLKNNLAGYEILAHKLNVETNLRDLLKNELIDKSGKREISEKSYCYEPWLHITIWPNETLSACSFPNISERAHLANKTLKEVWFGEYFKNLRDKIKKGEVPEYCKRCVANVVLDNIKLKEDLKKDV